jgi:hypothetical protein
MIPVSGDDPCFRFSFPALKPKCKPGEMRVAEMASFAPVMNELKDERPGKVRE